MSITPKAGFGYQQQLLPGMHPGGAPMPNFFMPMAQQGQQGPRPGGRRPVQQTQQSVPLMQQQMMPRGRMYRYPPAGRNVGDMPVPGGGQMFPVPYDMGGGMLPRDSAAAIPQPPIPVTALASALAISTPEQQRTGLWKASLFGAYDKAAIKFRGVEADINFTLEDYEEDLKQVAVFWLRQILVGGSCMELALLWHSPWKLECGDHLHLPDGLFYMPYRAKETRVV